MESGAGCKEANRGAEGPAGKGQRGKRPSEHGPAHHGPVGGKTLMHTNLHVNRCSSSEADIMMKRDN